ncbi:GAF domain-containing protein [Rhizobacter sp. AJA081-3]|uniref:GAF domain-containing protein n=1 Tax=Rhizobacter sp. AJA081-3 TaxID=2753607 RepID=UPI001ADFBF38|nr:GAF domain-containing protein [Rhizobacter sp. AJA081-3]QTN25763.1 GAF domain-containing protein [Rhizobacter sp. AJA081-3]
MSHLPSLSLLESRPARIEWARQRFFEEGQVPTGVVSEAVFESWARCLRRHGNPHERAAFEPVTASRTQLALLKNRPLRQAWMDEVPRLESALSSTSCAWMLTDATGVLIGSTCVGRSHEALMPVATRLGVNLSEDAVGTTAPGVAARTGKPLCVQGGEHFFDSVKEMHCAAAPIRDIRGQIAGVLDLSSERIPFSFDAAAVAGVFAGAIENRLLVAQSTEHLVIRFQITAELLDTAMVGLIGIDAEGRIAWENAAARSLLGGSTLAVHHEDRTPDRRLGLSWPQLASLPASGAAPLSLPNGLLVWARAEMRMPDGLRGLVPAWSPPVVDTAEVGVSTTQGTTSMPLLRESDLALIQRTLHACKGNVSGAAKQLGVSRGLIYRRLRAAGPCAEARSA